MKIYFAGAENYYDALHNAGVQCVLSSYISLRQWKPPKIKQWLSMFNDTFCDSGAYSAYTKGKKIDLEEYINFLKKYQFNIYACLDVIGDAETTLNNLEIMTQAQLTPLPVFHIGADFSYFEHYCNQYNYIAVGGLVPYMQQGQQKKICKFLDRIFCKTRDKIKIHAFGLVTPRLLKKYPFYSVDSFKWGYGSKFGNIIGADLKKSTFAIYSKRHREAFKAMNHGKWQYKKANAINIATFLQYEKDITRLWKMRGIIYD